MSDRILRERERRAKTGLSRTTTYELEKKGLHPKRVMLTGGRVGWLESELQAWVKNRPRAAETA